MRNRIGIGVIFVALYLLFYRYFTSNQRQLPDEWPWILIPVFLVLFSFFFWRNLRKVRAHNEGLSLMQQGRVVEALSKFEQARKTMRSAIPSMNIGMANLCLWRIPEAISALEEFQKRSKSPLGLAPGMELISSSHLALAYSLQGNEAASREALRRVGEGKDSTSASLLAEVVLGCRAGSWLTTQQLMTSNAMKLDQLGGSFRALADVLRAWVASNTGGQGGYVDSSRLFRETTSDSLKRVWPELVEFVGRAESEAKQKLA